METLKQSDVEPPIAADRPILFFDGVCGLCNRFVDFIVKRDRHARIRLAPLQGETASRLLSEHDRTSLDSLVYCDGSRSFRRSSAVLRVFRCLGGLWWLPTVLLWLIPRPIRDCGYQLIARNRYRLFGVKSECRLPTPDERTRFLD